MLGPETEILKTVLYFDIFDYPLSLAEIARFLHAKIPVPFVEVEVSLRNLVNRDELEGFGGYYFIKGRRDLVDKRQRRRLISEKKVRSVAAYLNIIFRLPWIKMVALTGAVAMFNSEESGDVDVLIVTARNRLWLSRMIIFLFLEFVGRKRNDKKRPSSRSICINVWCDENNLAVPKEEHDLVLAHEVAQVRVLYNRGKTYERFLEANLWLNNFLPNWKP
ncbi:MAG: hypothetical protein M1352_01265 [Patescibacteria group bacterium]|nr:hypothetical protein [Patescibacteria group bacterium]